MNWLNSGALVTGVIAGIVVLVVTLILGAIFPTVGFEWALGVATVNGFFAGYFGHIAGARRGLRS